MRASLAPTEFDREATAQALHVVVVSGLAHIKEHEWRVGQALAKIRQFDLYTVFGYATFSDYLQSPEVDLSFGRAYRYMNSAERFSPLVENGQLTQTDLVLMGTTKGEMILPVLDRDPQDLLEWVEKAKQLSKAHLKQELRRARPDQANAEDALAYLEQLSAKLIGLASTLPDADDPVSRLRTIAEIVAAAVVAWQSGAYRVERSADGLTR